MFEMKPAHFGGQVHMFLNLCTRQVHVFFPHNFLYGVYREMFKGFLHHNSPPQNARLCGENTMTMFTVLCRILRLCTSKII